MTINHDWGVIFAPAVRDQWDGRIWHGAGPTTVARYAPGGRPVYLATPYTLRAQRDGKWSYEASLHASAQAARELGRLARVGVTGISPIVQSAEMVHAEAFERVRDAAPLDPLDAGFWHRWCRPILNACAAVVVPDIEGWPESAGVLQEVIETLRETQKPIFFYAARS